MQCLHVKIIPLRPSQLLWLQKPPNLLRSEEKSKGLCKLKERTRRKQRWDGRELCFIFLVSLKNLFYINIAESDMHSLQRSQQAVPGKGMTCNNQHVFQSKFMLLAVLAAPQYSCNCPLQHRTAAKQLWQEGFFKWAPTSWDSEQLRTCATVRMEILPYRV